MAGKPDKASLVRAVDAQRNGLGTGGRGWQSASDMQDAKMQAQHTKMQVPAEGLQQGNGMDTSMPMPPDMMKDK